MLLHCPKISGKRWVRAALSACGLLSNIIATNHTPRLQQIQHEGLHLQVIRRTKLVSQFDCPALLKQGVHRVIRTCSLSCTLDCAGKCKWGTQLRRLTRWLAPLQADRGRFAPGTPGTNIVSQARVLSLFSRYRHRQMCVLYEK